MMNFNKVALTIALALSVAACGSDNDGDSVQAPVVEPPVQEKPDYIDVAVSPQAPMDGTVQVRLGAYQDNITSWLHENPGIGDPDKGNGKTSIKNAADAGVVNQNWPEGHAFNVEIADVDRVLRENPDGLGAGSYRPDIFIEGRYSVFDVLRYLAVTRDDLELTIVKDHNESGLGTPLYTVSWDQNGDGQFDADEVDNENWHFRLFAMGDEFTRAISNSQGFHAGGELNYMRMDEMWANPNTRYNLQPFSEYMTARRHWVQKTQVERQKERGFVLQQFEADSPVIDQNATELAPDGRTQKITVKLHDVPVTANNHRPDIFQPGVITGMDIFVAAGKESEAQGYGDFSYTFWNVLHTGAEVGNYAVTQFLGIRNKGLRGWLTYYVEGEDYQTAAETNRDVFFEPSCNWNANGEPVAADSSDKIPKEACFEEWSGTFGGTLIHIMSDIAVHNYLPENAVVRYGNQYASWNPDIESRQYDADYTSVTETLQYDYSVAKDGSDVRTLRAFKAADVTSGSNAPLLNEAHFGWNIADCTLCHNEEKQPLGHGGHNWPTPYADGFDNTQPAYCASCHGTNGAPVGHGELDTCFWCHDGDLEGKQHGEASLKHQVTGDDIRANDLDRYGNIPNYQGYPSDALGNYKKYESVTTSGNSNYHLGQTFPDPFSCLSCHPND
ncbi:hypothetical protein [Ferrimonas lipolytica]|uniref:Uncharacterized protein n=1 Tax=Ferrimonas lipolytica TaxID=2724191 RepID=A0A6H1UE18_9GAMM|nr:hypothetical protein [Ferrimonas lipolytica]QIZ76466.1 hypothetical protein HER31_06070 [Ferrimonas lipolytica]